MQVYLIQLNVLEANVFPTKWVSSLMIVTGVMPYVAFGLTVLAELKDNEMLPFFRKKNAAVVPAPGGIEGRPSHA